MNSLSLTVRDLITLLSLITSLGTVWGLYREIRRPRDDMNEMVERHERTLKDRRSHIDFNSRRITLALRVLFDLAKDRPDLQEQLIDEMSKGDNDENL